MTSTTVVPIVRRSVRAVLFDDDARLVTIKRTKPGVAPYWTTAGGGVEPGDISREAALQRELLEELGARVVVGQQLTLVTSAADGGQSVQYFFAARLVSIDASLRSGREHTDAGRGGYELERIPLDELAGYDLKPAKIKGFILDNSTALLTEHRDHPPNAMPLALNVVHREGRRYMSSWFPTALVLDAAGELLNAWCITADQHGVNMAGAYPAGEWAERLAVIALEMTSRNVRDPRPGTHEQAIALLDAVVRRLAERGVSTKRDVLRVPLPRIETTPDWGTAGPCPLAITIDLERGWLLVIDQPTGSPVVEVVGRCDEAGIDALLDLADIVNEGAYGNVFHR